MEEQRTFVRIAVVVVVLTNRQFETIQRAVAHARLTHDVRCVGAAHAGARVGSLTYL